MRGSAILRMGAWGCLLLVDDVDRGDQNNRTVRVVNPAVPMNTHH
jgi:hypothetical protein